MSKYLDESVLAKVWSNAKAYIDKKPLISGASIDIVIVTLSATNWDESKAQTVEAAGVLADETKQVIQPMLAAANQQAYYDAGILCTGQGIDSLTFSADTVPTEDLTIYVAITKVVEASNGNL